MDPLNQKPPFFKDANGERWTLTFTFGTLRKIRTEVGLDVFEILTDPSGFFETCAADVMLIIDSIYVASHEKCVERGLTPNEFGDLLMKGEGTLDKATDAFTEACICFFETSRPSQGRALRKLWTIFRRMRDTVDASLDETLTKFEHEFSKSLERLESTQRSQRLVPLSCRVWRRPLPCRRL